MYPTTGPATAMPTKDTHLPTPRGSNRYTSHQTIGRLIAMELSRIQPRRHQIDYLRRTVTALAAQRRRARSGNQTLRSEPRSKIDSPKSTIIGSESLSPRTLRTRNVAMRENVKKTMPLLERKSDSQESLKPTGMSCNHHPIHSNARSLTFHCISRRW